MASNPDANQKDTTTRDAKPKAHKARRTSSKAKGGESQTTAQAGGQQTHRSRAGRIRSKSLTSKAAKYKTLPAADPAVPPQLPYIQFVETRHKLNIWTVDGAYVRTNIDEEFTNFGQHYRFKQIPKNELWLDHESDPDEQKFFIEHLLTEYRLMAKGEDYDDAITQADEVEQKARLRAGDLRKVKPEAKALPDPGKVHVRLWKKLPDGVEVWFVKGRLVRSAFNIDFSEGGHEHVYEFVPHNEVWIDDDTAEHEKGYVLLHELHERNLMAKGMDYDHAHADSSRLEHHCREHPERLHDALTNEGWE